MYLYERIYGDLRLSIEEGEVRPGERLPSIRELALRYNCSKLTVQRAMDALETAGAISNRAGSGAFVLYPEPPEEHEGDFSAARLSESFFPYKEAGGLLASLLAEEKGRVFSAAPDRGEAELREAVAQRYSLSPEGITILSGGQEALDLCRRLFLSLAGQDEAHYLVEEPSYPAAISLFRPDASLPLLADGPNPDVFADFFSGKQDAKCRIFYTMPDLHNPTGIRYSRDKKMAIAELARKLDVYIIEDDYLSELDCPCAAGIPSSDGSKDSSHTVQGQRARGTGTAGRVSPATASLPLTRGQRSGSSQRGGDGQGSQSVGALNPSIPRFADLVPERTLWLKSLSKTTAPGLRIGVLSAPAALMPRLDAVRAEADAGPATWLQLFTASFLRSELFDAHLARCASIALHRRAELCALLDRFPWLSYNRTAGGFNIWVETAGCPELAAPPWAPGRPFGLYPAINRNRIRLSFMAMSEEEWPAALSRLEQALSSSAPRKK